MARVEHLAVVMKVLLAAVVMAVWRRQVHVFDLAENKHEPLCDQKVISSPSAALMQTAHTSPCSR